MELTQYTNIAVSVAATLFSIVLIAVLIAGAYLFKRVTAVMDQIDKVSKVALDTTSSLHDFVEKVTSRATGFMETFMTLQGAREVAGAIGQVITGSKKKK
jgi:uncharacterized protein (UPF0333 family)